MLNPLVGFEPFVLMEATVYDPALPGTRTLYFSDVRDYRTLSTDTPSGQVYLGRLADPGDIVLDAVPAWGGSAPVLTAGTIVLANGDGALDKLDKYIFDGWPVSLYYATLDAATGALTKTPLFNGVMEQPDFGLANGVMIVVRSQTYGLDRPILTGVYGGTGALDGDSTIQGKLKPRVYGSVWNAAPITVDAANLIYQISDRAVSTGGSVNVYDAGLGLTSDGTVGSQVALYAAVVAAGHFVLWSSGVSGSFVKLGSTPAQITFDATDSTYSAISTAQLFAAILVDAGNVSGVYNQDRFGGNDCNGYFLTDGSTYAAVLSQVAARSSAWWFWSTLYQTWILHTLLPAADLDVSGPSYVFDQSDVLDIQKIGRPPTPNAAIPPWSLTVLWGKNETVQTSGLAGAVTAARRQFLANQYRTATKQDTSILTSYPLSVPLIITSNEDLQSAAQTKANNLFTAFTTLAKDFYKITLNNKRGFVIEPGSGAAVDPDQPLGIRHSRFGFVNARKGTAFYPMGVRHILKSRQIEVTGWTRYTEPA